MSLADPKAFLRDLADSLDEDFPDTRQVLVCLETSRDETSARYTYAANRITRADAFYLLEMVKQKLLSPPDER